MILFSFQRWRNPLKGWVRAIRRWGVNNQKLTGLDTTAEMPLHKKRRADIVFAGGGGFAAVGLRGWSGLAVTVFEVALHDW